ncbi:MAG: hypothetical protein KAT58_04185 [candidate division Zixibacteria bacterium]|nr:hypothetical protein [candidate division Zixibacteria bacterium]
MTKAKYGVILIAMILSAGALLAFNEPGDFILVDNNRAIQMLGKTNPFISTNQLPDTVPPYFPHPKDLRFKNEKFHFITISPSGELIGFASGEENQWIGLMNVKEKYLKFLAWGMRTEFLDLTFSPNSKYISYTFHGPDHRTKLMIIETPGRDVAKPKPLNTWFKTMRNGEQFEPIGWVQPGDTTFSFTVSDSTGKLIEKIDLPLHIDWNNLPEQMRKERRKPSGVIKTDDQ